MDGPREDYEKKLSQFFGHLGLVNFDKCREILEKERENRLAVRTPQVRHLFTLLLNFIEAEKSYHNLGFMSTKKIFLRKDNSLKSMYESLKTDLNKIEDANSTDQNINSLINQLIQFLTARIQLIDFYEKIYILGTSVKHINYYELQNQIEQIIESHTFSFLHPMLKPIRNTVTNECAILIHLFGAHVELQNWNFIPSIMHLQAAHTKLTSWEKSLQSKESWKLGFGTSFLKGSHLPQLYQWLHKLKSSVLNKFTGKNTLKSISLVIGIEFENGQFRSQILQSLPKKSMASSVLLLFDPSGLVNWAGPGFQHPERPKELLTSQYLVMIAHPPFKYGDRMVGISKALSERSPEYTLPDKVVSVYNAEDKCSYFISSIDLRITLVAIFDMKKDERDINVVNHLTEFCSQVRCTKLYQSLKTAK
nr:KICSTOR complex protein C12orf66 homolog [Halyomorpha halys]